MNLYKINPETQSSIRMKFRARIELLLGIGIVLTLTLLSSAFEIEFVESLFEFTRAHEDWELDEIIFSFIWVALISSIYGVRRVLDIKTVNKEVSQRAYYDSLTGLPNRSMALYQLEMSLKRAKQRNLSIVVIFLDLDSFKEVNDSHGHDSGDLLIKKLERR
ncbi:diguanylate cyclase [Vibrio sp. kj40-1]|uniref:Diguanylate cyclase n=1 Tax=Vibrio algarum TaxID=3020714 RepID=A0ABT4YV79_9VIBR|nr:diguanylate cyclase [Vibrio sp. KJ40-1]MDB1125494.1 diguanylate cyclase [Vibrio sp. KJ40-1]